MIDNIANLAKSINMPSTKPESIIQGTLQEMIQNLTRIDVLHNDLTIALEFYNNFKTFVEKLNSKVSEFCEAREKQLLNLSSRIDPGQNNLLFSNTNIYQQLEASITKPNESNFRQFSSDKNDIGAKWSSIQITRSVMFDANMNPFN